MKKKLFGIMLVLAVILFAGYTVYNSHGDIKLSDVTLANLEALADENDDNSEAGGASHSCYKKWRKAPEDDGFVLWGWICQECEFYWLLEAKYTSTCNK